jgi:hypothetical protein
MFVDASSRRLFWRSARLSWLVIFALILAMPAHADELTAVFGRSSTGSTMTIDHRPFGVLLQRYAKLGRDGIVRVDYTKFQQKDRSSLKAYIAKISATDVAALDRPEQFALWANLYNAKTLDIVLDHYPVSTIKDVSLGGGLLAAFSGGPWKAKVVTVGGVSLSLDDIEHGILRPIFQDVRVHYAVNCASFGCPNLPLEPFTGAALEKQLELAARGYVNHPRAASLIDNRLVVSSIYRWYKSDFGNSDRAIIEHLKRYAEPDLARRLGNRSEIDDDRYDWSLNESAHPR